MFLVFNAKSNDRFNIVITKTKFEIFFAKLRTIRGNKNLYDIAFYFVAQMVGLFFVERNNKIAQAIGSVFKHLFRV